MLEVSRDIDNRYFPSHQEANDDLLTQCETSEYYSTKELSIDLGTIAKRQAWIRGQLLTNYHYSNGVEYDDISDSIGFYPIPLEQLEDKKLDPGYDYIDTDDVRYNVYKEFLYLNKIPENWVLPENNLDAIESLDELFTRDDNAFDFGNKTYAVVALENDQYRGHVYCWDRIIDDNTIVMNIMGIRSSIKHILFPSGSKLSPILFAAIRQFTQVLYPDKRTYLRIIHPYDWMNSVSKKLGFTVDTKFYLTHKDLTWLLPNKKEDEEDYNIEELHETYFEGGPLYKNEQYDEGNMIYEANKPMINESNYPISIHLVESFKSLNHYKYGTIYNSIFYPKNKYDVIEKSTMAI